tara:strand:- start:33332 stop:33916 length:585 start_codon:yes stop_codon:yes gene_type:complete
MFELIPSYLIPVLIFLARITDVSLGTLRIVMVSRGFKLKATILGFFEVLIWVLVIGQLIQNLDSVVNYVAYAGGFATGTYVGMMIEGKLKVGTIIVRIITRNKFQVLTEALKASGFTITTLDAKGGVDVEPVKIIFTVLKRKRWNEIVTLIEANDPQAFYSSEDVKFSNSVGEIDNLSSRRSPVNRLLGVRKGI